MAAEESPKQELSEAAAPVVDAVAREWSTNKLLLAVLPPTLALLSVAVGVWDNGNRDRAAAAADRTARSEEIAREQANAEHEARLREAELVLPRYESLLVAMSGPISAAATCKSDVDQWLSGDNGWGTMVGTAVAFNADGTGGELISADTPFLTSCQLTGDLEPFSVSLDQALIVSKPDLERPARELDDALAAVNETALHLANVPRSGESQQYLDGSAVDAAGLNFRDNVQKLSDELEEVEAASDRLFETVRGVLLLDS